MTNKNVPTINLTTTPENDNTKANKIKSNVTITWMLIKALPVNLNTTSGIKIIKQIKKASIKLCFILCSSLYWMTNLKKKFIIFKWKEYNSWRFKIRKYISS